MRWNAKEEADQITRVSEHQFVWFSIAGAHFLWNSNSFLQGRWEKKKTSFHRDQCYLWKDWLISSTTWSLATEKVQMSDVLKFEPNSGPTSYAQEITDQCFQQISGRFTQTVGWNFYMGIRLYPIRDWYSPSQNSIWTNQIAIFGRFLKADQTNHRQSH